MGKTINDYSVPYYRMECPSCNQSYEIEQASFAQTMDCQFCGTKMDIPPLGHPLWLKIILIITYPVRGLIFICIVFNVGFLIYFPAFVLYAIDIVLIWSWFFEYLGKGFTFLGAVCFAVGIWVQCTVQAILLLTPKYKIWNS
jgi:hypothetical protein